MPVAAKRPCTTPSCPHLQPCPVHVRHRRPTQSYAARQQAEPWRWVYKTAQWQRLRLRVLKAQPLCPACEARGRLVLASVVDHIQPHRGDAALAFDPANLQPLCASCHSRKTAGESWHAKETR